MIRPPAQATGESDPVASSRPDYCIAMNAGTSIGRSERAQMDDQPQPVRTLGVLPLRPGNPAQPGDMTALEQQGHCVRRRGGDCRQPG